MCFDASISLGIQSIGQASGVLSGIFANANQPSFRVLAVVVICCKVPDDKQVASQRTNISRIVVRFARSQPGVD